MSSPIEKNNNPFIGQNILRMRQQCGLTQKDVAEILGVTVSAVSKFEAGITDINFSRLQQFASIFGIDVAQLLSVHEERVNIELVKITAVRKKLLHREAEIVSLQRKIIGLYQELVTI